MNTKGYIYIIVPVFIILIAAVLVGTSFYYKANKEDVSGITRTQTDAASAVTYTNTALVPVMEEEAEISETPVQEEPPQVQEEELPEAVVEEHVAETEPVTEVAELLASIALPGWDEGYQYSLVPTAHAQTDVSELALRGWGLAMDRKGSYLYIADGPAGLQVVNVQNPREPKIAGSVQTGEYASIVKIFGDYAYVGETDGMKIVHVANPQSPSLTGSFSAEIAQNSPRDIVVAGRYAYITDASAQVLIADVHEPTAPTLSKNYLRHDGTMFRAGYDGTYVYLLSPDRPEYSPDPALRVVDIAAPTEPTPIAEYRYDGALKVLFDGTTMYLHNYGGVHILDASDPENLVTLGTIGGGFDDFALTGTRVYTMTKTSVAAWDVRNPANPTGGQAFTHPEFTSERGEGLSAIHADGEHAFVLRGADVPPGGKVIAPATVFVLRFP